METEGAMVTGISLVFAINGERFELSGLDPSTTVLEFLRQKTRYKGPKLGCGEGGCGACVVLLAKFNPVSKLVEEFAVSSCLTLLCSIHLCSVTTSEGLGNKKNGFHSIHRRISGFHASQCGFCTPGMCMSLYSSLSNADKSQRPEPEPGFSKLTLRQAEKAIAGHLCRCTGYRPIVDTCKSFSSEVDMEDLGLNTFWRTKEQAGVEKMPLYNPQAVNTFPDFLKVEIENLFLFSPSQGEGKLKVKQLDVSMTHGYSGSGSSSCFWYCPKSITELQFVLKISGKIKTKLVVGNTASGIYREQNQYNCYVDLNGVKELVCIRKDDAGIEIGAAVTISRVIQVLKEEVEGQNLTNGKLIFSKLAEHMERVGSPFIRNTASLGGNLIIAQRYGFPSDIATILATVGAHVVIKINSEISVFSIEEFLVMPVFDTGFLLLSVWIPNWENQPHAGNLANGEPASGSKLLFDTYRAAPRPIGSALAYVNAAFLAQVDSESSLVENICIFFRAYGVKHLVRAREVEEFLVGKRITVHCILEAIKLLKINVLPMENTSDPSYKKSLTTSFLFEFLVTLAKESIWPSAGLTDLQDSPNFRPVNGKPHDVAAQTHYSICNSRSEACSPVPPSRQIIKFSSDYIPVGEPTKKSAVEIQASGEAVYVDDIPSPPGCLHGAFVCGQQPLVSVKEFEIRSSLALGNCVAFVSVKDIPDGGKNIGSANVFGEDPLFADSVTLYSGQPIGLVVADTQKLANATAVQAVLLCTSEKVELPILTVEDAVKRSSFFEIPEFLKPRHVGDFAKGMQEAEHKIISAEMRLGSQYYFYMETQTALAIPDEDNCMVVYSSTQCPEMTQATIAKCLGIPMHNVRVITRRVGGGFGGKAMKAIPVATACSLAAFKLRRPVRMYLDRKTDMILAGGRHPMKITYSVGFRSEGKITALHLDILINAGITEDASPAIPWNLIGTLKKYNWGALSFNIKVCKTNLPSKSVMRAPGELQGSYIAEAIIEHVASILLIESDAVRKLNLHTFESLRLFYERRDEDPLEYTLPLVFDKLASSANLQHRVEKIKKFNNCNTWKKRGISTVPIIHPVVLRPTPGRVGILSDGSVVVEVGGVELGQGLWTKVQQMAAFALGQLGCDTSQDLLPRVRVIQADTLSLMQGGFTAGSTTSESSCEAVRLACDVLVGRLRPIKESLQEKMRLVSWVDLILQATMQSVNLSAGTLFAPEVSSMSYLNYGAATSEVEICLLTGATTILQTDLIYDCGQSLNPAVDLGQIEGAFVQGIGFFMLEEYLSDENGMVISDGTFTYKIPTVDTIPKQFNVEILNSGHHKERVLSSKASGEPPLLLAASVHCATREAIKAARKDLFSCGGHVGGSSSPEFQLPVPATMPVVKELCGFDNVERFLESVIANNTL